MALSDFLNGYRSVSLYSDVIYAHIRQHKKVLYCTKNCCVNKKSIFRIEINVAQQNYVSRKKICCGNKKYYVTPRKRLMLTKCV